MKTKQDDYRFANDILKLILKLVVFWVLQISLKYFCKCPIDTKAVIIKIMAWCTAVFMHDAVSIS